MAEKEEKKKPKIPQHEFVPQHRVLDDEEKKEVLEEYGIKLSQLPRIKSKDKAIKHLDVSTGDVIEVTRKSRTAGETKYYRVVVGKK